MTVLILIMASSVQAQVTAVTLYPQGGEVTEQFTGTTEEMSAGSCAVHVDLPLGADQNSVRVKRVWADDTPYPIEDVGFSVKARVDHDKIKELKARLEESQAKERKLEAQRESLEMRKRMWASQSSATGEEVREADRLLDLDKAMQGALEELLLGIKQTEVELGRVQENIRELQHRIEGIGAGEDKKRVASIVFAAKPCPESVEAELSYHHGDCGWEPVYRVAALPDEDKTVFSWKARVHQSTGQDWENASLTLSTSKPQRQMSPPGTGSWVIQPRPRAIPKFTNQRKTLGKAEGRADMMDTAAAAPQGAKRIRGSGFDLWDVGIKTVKAGQERRISIREYEWGTDFSFLIRPGVAHRAFLKALIESKDNVMIPRGQAMIAVDGQLIGKQPFSFQGRNKEMHFGDLPEITGKRVLVDKEAGEEGILMGKKQAHRFSYRYEITNGRDEDILVRVEDARPRTRHEDIEVELSSSLAYETGDNTISWDVTINPGQTATIPLNVVITAPKDMDITMPR